MRDGQTITFEASVNYYSVHRAFQYIPRVLPCTRLVFILRNPTARARSLYYHERKDRPYKLQYQGNNSFIPIDRAFKVHPCIAVGSVSFIDAKW